MLYQARHDSTSEISCIFHHSQNGSFRSHQILKVNCQRITHVGCCIKRKPRENIKVCVNVSRTSYRQATDRLPTHYQQSADCRPTGSLYFGQNLSAVCRPTVGRQTADCRPTDDQLSADCRSTVDRQSADRFFGELVFTITNKSLLAADFHDLITKS